MDKTEKREKKRFKARYSPTRHGMLGLSRAQRASLKKEKEKRRASEGNTVPSEAFFIDIYDRDRILVYNGNGMIPNY